MTKWSDHCSESPRIPLCNRSRYSLHPLDKDVNGRLRCILDFDLSRNQRQGSEYFPGKVQFMRWFPVDFLTNGALNVTDREINLRAPVL